jgi:hypothetical protein
MTKGKRGRLEVALTAWRDVSPRARRFVVNDLLDLRDKRHWVSAEVAKAFDAALSLLRVRAAGVETRKERK